MDTNARRLHRSAPADSMLFFLGRGSRSAVLLRAALMVAAIAFADWRVEGNVPLGFLYLFPMLIAAGVLNRWQIAIVAGLCTYLTELFDSFEWMPETGVPRDILVFAAFFCMGLFVYEVARNRQSAQEHLERIESEAQARREAEEQLQILIESSPAAIFTADGEGRVVLANDAAHRLVGLPPASLIGKPIGAYLPALAHVPALANEHQSFRTVMQGRGRREDGEVFLADIWFSTYRTAQGPRLAAMVVDTSEDLRNREELSLHHLLAASRVLVGAVGHEIRNVCGAIAMVHQNLAREGSLRANKDFEALGTLVTALERIAACDLRQSANQAAGIDLAAVLDELRIVVEPGLRESEIAVAWDIEPGLPAVWADRQSLMQVFLNVVNNGVRAMGGMSRRLLQVSARAGNRSVTVRIRDTGPGVAHPERLFRPFQHGAEATGLGLYLSRALMRSFRGDLRYEPQADGSSFIVELSLADSEAADEEIHGSDPDTVDRRSQSLSRESQPAASSRA